MCPINKRYGREIDGKTAPFSVIAAYTKDGRRVDVNRDAGRINQYDSRDFSEKTILAHKNAEKLLDCGEFLNLASHTGVREGLSFEGEDSLRYDNIVFGRRPDKILFWAYSDLDRHGHDRALDEELFQNWWVISNLATVAVRIPVPFGSIVPKGLDGIVTAGRCFSVDTYAQSAVRMNRDMFRMGECVGTAAAMAVKSGVSFLDIDYEEYIRRVRALGCFDGDANKKFGFDYPGGDKPYIPVEFDVRKNLHLLKTETPGIAVWSCFICSGKSELAEELLCSMSAADDTLYKYNLAIALGIMGDKRALPTLREIVRERDCFYFKDCRRSNQFRSAVAICLLGRLGEAVDIPLLEEIVFGADEFSRELYHTLEPNYLYYNGNDRNFVYFDIFTHAAAALVKIYRRCGVSLHTLNERFKALLSEGSVVRRIAPNCEPHETPYAETVDFLRHMINLTA